MTDFVIIVAGGRGKRMNTSTPKQFIKLQGKAILHHTILKFNEVLPSFKIVVVLPEDQIDYWKDYLKENSVSIEHEIIIGGKERFFSVKNALDTLTNARLVGIHDGVRPFVSAETIKKTKDSALKFGNAVPVVSVKESLREVNSNGTSQSRNRDQYKLVQTPQFFNFELLQKAYHQKFNPNFTDDSSVVEELGEQINLVMGNVENIKLTTPLDLKLAEVLISQQSAQ